MLKAYFDESGTHGTSNMVVVAGLIHSSQEWQALDRAWKIRLKQFQKKYPQVTCFHLTKCRGERGHGEFRDIPKDERYNLIDDLTEVVCKHSPTIVASAVFKSSWAKLAGERFRRRFRTPYHLCLEHCIQQIRAIVDDGNERERVAIICSDQMEYKRRAIEVHEEYRAHPAFANFDALAFHSPENFMPLQAADLIAGETWAYADPTLAQGLPIIRENLKMMIVAGLHTRGGYYNDESLGELILRGPTPWKGAWWRGLA